MKKLSASKSDRAIVVGASIAGLLSARVLSDHFRDVLVVDSDALPDEPITRKAVPQANHAHALLEGGRAALEVLFPEFTQTLIDLGAPYGGGQFHSAGGFFARDDEKMRAIFVSRPLLELEVRKRVSAIENVSIRSNTFAESVEFDERDCRVAGVRLAPSDNREMSKIESCDLAVDAGGRVGRSSKWLRTIGYPEPEVELVNVEMGYASRLFRRFPGQLNDDCFVTVGPTTEHPKACALIAQEDERWMLTLAGYFGRHPPSDEAGYLDFAKSLQIPDVYDFAKSASPISDIVLYQFPADQRRRFDRMKEFPKGLLVIGDSICSLTPVYGQGMTVAAQEALVLQACLKQGIENLAVRFFKKANKVIDVAWAITAGNDRALIPGNKSLTTFEQSINWYLNRFQLAAHTDARLAAQFMEVANMHAPPASLLRPEVIFRVMFGNAVKKA